jgi:hypothetical protein
MRYAALHIRRSYLHSILLPNVAASAMCSHADGSTHGYVGSGSTPAVISPLALGLLHPNQRTCQTTPEAVAGIFNYFKYLLTDGLGADRDAVCVRAMSAQSPVQTFGPAPRFGLRPPTKNAPAGSAAHTRSRSS